MAKFKKCPRCDLNYILEEEDLCDICKKELNGVNFGEIDEAEDELDEICPVCRINFLEEAKLFVPPVWKNNKRKRIAGRRCWRKILRKTSGKRMRKRKRRTLAIWTYPLSH